MISGGRGEGFRAKSLAQKAEEMRAQRASYEAARARLEKLLVVARSFDSASFKFVDKEEAISRATRRPAYDEAERLVTSLEDEAKALLVKKLEEKETEFRSRMENLPQFGLEASAEQKERFLIFAKARSEGNLGDTVKEELLLDQLLTQTEGSALGDVRDQIGLVLAWAIPDAPDSVKNLLAPCLELADHKELLKASTCAEETLRQSVPQVAEKLASLAEEVTRTLPLAKQLRLDVTEAERALTAFKSPKLLFANRLGKNLESASQALDSQEKEAVRARMAYLKSVLERAVTGGADAGDSLHELDALTLELEKLPPAGALPRLSHAESIIEAPVLHVVFEHLEEVRSYLEEARELDRNVEPLVESISHVRNAIHDNDFGRALDASNEALDKARHLVADVEVVRNELEEYKALLSRLAKKGLEATPFEAFSKRAEEAILARNFDAAREALREGIRSVGKESSQTLRDQLLKAERALEGMSVRHWGFPEDLSSRTEEANLLLSSGRVEEAAEVVADISSRLKSSVVGQYNSRLEEIDATIDTLGDDEVRRHAHQTIQEARATPGSGSDGLELVDTLQKLEREISVTFATEVGRIVADLDDNLVRLGKIGITTEDFAREITQVREIFDLGDYIRAVETGQEVTERMRQKALARAEEAISEAKLSLVELSKTVPEPASVRELLDSARLSLQNSNYLGAVETAAMARATASDIKATAQKIVDRISQVVNQMTALRRRGTSPDDLRVLTSKIADVRTAYQSMAFDHANSTIDEITVVAENIGIKLDVKAAIESIRGTIEATASLGLPENDWADRVVGLVKGLDEEDSKALLSLSDALIAEVLEKVVPVFNEQMQTLENEVKVARQQGLDTKEADAMLATVRAQLAERFPRGVARNIGQIKTQFFQSKAFQETANRALAEAREIINQAEFLQLDMDALISRVAQVEQQVRDSDFGGALEASNAIKDEASEAVRSHLNHVLSNLQGLISRTKREGALTMVAENYLAKARGLVGQSPPAEILQLVNLAENELERSELQYSIAQNSVQMLTAKVVGLENEGLVVPQGPDGLARAKQAFESGEYNQVLDIVLSANDYIQQAAGRQSRAKETLRKASDVVTAARAANIDVPEAEAALRSFEESSSKGLYEEADSSAHEAYEKARTAFDSRLTLDIESIKRVFELLTGDDAALESLKKTMEEVRQSQAKEEWTAAVGLAEQSRKAAASAVLRLLGAEMTRVADLEGRLPKETVQDLDTTLRDGERALKSWDFGTATGACKDLRTKVDAALSAYVATGIDYLEKGSRTAERLGLDGTPVVESLSEVRTLMRQPTPDMASKKLSASTKKLDELLTPAMEGKLEGAGRAVLLAQESLNVAVNGLDDRVQAARERMQKGDLLGSAEDLLETLKELAHRKSRQQELVTLHYLIDTLMGQATEAKKPFEGPSELLEQSIQFKSSGEYDKAIKAANEAVQALKQSLA